MNSPSPRLPRAPEEDGAGVLPEFLEALGAGVVFLLSLAVLFVAVWLITP